MSDWEAVGRFHKKFDLDHVSINALKIPHLINDKELIKFRINFLKEELQEIEDAFANDDLEGIADGLIDLVYVALGTAHFHHLPWEDLFYEVHCANMKKRRTGSKRGGIYDVTKPEGWKKPDIKLVLKVHGWKDDK